MRRSKTGRAALAGAALLLTLAAWPATAAVTVTDSWGGAGTVSLDSGTRRLTFSKRQPGAQVHDTTAPVMSLVPFDANGDRATGTVSCKVAEASPGSARCEVVFSAKRQSIEAIFTLTAAGAIRIDPTPTLTGIAAQADFAYGVLPSRHLDDDVYDAADYPKPSRLCLPSESLLVGLFHGGSRVVALAWPPGDQTARLALTGAGKARHIEALEVTLAGRELFVGALSAPSIWQEVELQPDFEEQDTALDWKPPFQAAWKIQLTELGVPTTFRFVGDRRRPWRPTIGFYIWPFFSEGDKTLLHLHKKLASTGKALIYALEGNEQTPYAFLTANLAAEDQRKLTELHAVEHYYVLDPRPVEGGFVMNAHCAGRDQLKTTTLTVGAQARDVAFLDTHISDRVHECQWIASGHVQRSLDCIAALGEDLAGWRQQAPLDPGTQSFLDALGETLASMHDEYLARLGGETSEQMIQRIDGVGERFKALIRQDGGPETCPEILADINELNAIISLEEDQGRRFGTWGRKLFQQAGYACVESPTAAQHAQAFRSRLREHLRYRQYESPGTAGYATNLLPAQ
ncbi:MAG: hypothetical protein FJX75_15990 [Armatimonadetes bacterium]|nr:hypothetical protein [Armatimonadota bacterium]